MEIIRIYFFALGLSILAFFYCLIFAIIRKAKKQEIPHNFRKTIVWLIISIVLIIIGVVFLALFAYEFSKGNWIM